MRLAHAHLEGVFAVNRKVLLFVLSAAAVAVVVGSCALRRKSQTPSIPATAGVNAQAVKGPALPDPVAVILYDTSGTPVPCSSTQINTPLRGAALSFSPVVQPLPTRRLRRPLPTALQRFCVIRPPIPPPITQGLPPPRRPRIPLAEAEKIRSLFRGSAFEVGFDYPLVGTSGALDLLPRIEQRAAFQQRAGAPDAVSTTWPSPSVAPVRLALIDSLDASGAGWTYTSLSSDNHGAPLGRLIEELTCVGGIGTKDCLVDLVAYDALHSTSPSGQPAGALHDLADAIIAAVDDGDSTNKVLNISLGWIPLPSLGNVDPSQPMLGPTKAVYEALKYAACRNAVVFAAAGNYLGGPNGTFDTGLVYPAGWQGPVSLDCTQYGGVGIFKGSLVHAVGGLGASGEKMGLTRPGGFPTLAAFGVDGVSVKVPQASSNLKEHTLPMSGTSVATAVVSAAAAARWALESGLDNAAIADALRQAPSSLQADIKYGGTYAVKKIKVCEQAEAGCTSGSCGGGSFTCPVIGAPAPSGPTLALIAPSLTTVAAPTLTQKNCTDHTVWGVASNTTCMDNFTTSIDATPWVHPMPGCDPCLACVLSGSGVTGSQFSGLFNTNCMTLRHAWLVESDGSTSRIIDIGGLVASSPGGSLPTGGFLLDGLPLLGSSGMRVRLVSEATGSVAKITTAAEIPVLP